ncbi:DUF488 domain-containing protein, partial [Pasteurella multocida]|uniref:DUF488 domain-containing protein n=2 Tax=Pasteurella multocida TaxID=747 RepID=UPI002CFB9C4E
INFLVDVRSSPYSKYYPDFNRENLKIISLQYQIKYVFMGDTLGGRPDDPTCYSSEKDKEGKSQVLYNEIKKKDFFINSIERLVVANNKKIKIACMCSELNPCDCHRSKLIGEVLYNKNISTYHIDEKGLLKSQNEVINEITKGKNTISLFGDEIEFKSIGKY